MGDVDVCLVKQGDLALLEVGAEFGRAVQHRGFVRKLPSVFNGRLVS